MSESNCKSKTQKNIRDWHRFTLQFSAQDTRAEEWFLAQPNKGAYIKALILEDREKQEREGTTGPTVVTRSDRINADWDERLEQCKAFLQEHGRLPNYNETYQGVKLGRWLDIHIRKAEQKNDTVRLEKLRSIGALDGKWDKFFLLLADFVAEHGRLPNGDEQYRGMRLGSWLKRQKKLLSERSDTLTEAQRENLRRYVVYSDPWEEKYALLAEFAAEYGRLPRYQEEYRGQKLGRWLARQKTELNPTKHPYRLEKLLSIGAILPDKTK